MMSYYVYIKSLELQLNKSEDNDDCLVCGEESHWGVIYKGNEDEIVHEHFCNTCYNSIKKKTIKWPK